MNNLTPLQRECVTLFQAHQYKSCEIAARMELSLCRQQGRDPQLPLALLGDCAHAMKQYRRAVSFFRQLRPHKYRCKEAQCLQELGNVVEASSVLETVPAAHRTLEMNMTLGNLYVASGRRHVALSVFLEALQQNPYVMEATEWLATLGADRGRVLQAIQEGFQTRNNNSINTNESKVADDDNEMLLPLVDLASAIFAKHRHQTGPALQQFVQLEQQYPNNPYLLVKIAELQVCLRLFI